MLIAAEKQLCSNGILESKPSTLISVFCFLRKSQTNGSEYPPQFEDTFWNKPQVFRQKLPRHSYTVFPDFYRIPTKTRSLFPFVASDISTSALKRLQSARTKEINLRRYSRQHKVPAAPAERLFLKCGINKPYNIFRICRTVGYRNLRSCCRSFNKSVFHLNQAPIDIFMQEEHKTRIQGHLQY